MTTVRRHVGSRGGLFEGLDTFTDGGRQTRRDRVRTVSEPRLGGRPDETREVLPDLLVVPTDTDSRRLPRRTRQVSLAPAGMRFRRPIRALLGPEQG